MKNDEQVQMAGERILDPHANTAKCGKVNDRLRRRAKRIERSVLKTQIRSGEIFASRMGRA